MTTRERIIELAKQAKMPYDYVSGDVWMLDRLEKFYNLAIQAERDNFCKSLRYLHDTYAVMSDPSGLEVRRKGGADDRPRDVQTGSTDHDGQWPTFTIPPDEGVPGAVQHSGQTDGADGEQQGGEPGPARRKSNSVKKAKGG